MRRAVPTRSVARCTASAHGRRARPGDHQEHVHRRNTVPGTTPIPVAVTRIPVKNRLTNPVCAQIRVWPNATSRPSATAATTNGSRTAVGSAISASFSQQRRTAPDTGSSLRPSDRVAWTAVVSLSQPRQLDATTGYRAGFHPVQLRRQSTPETGETSLRNTIPGLTPFPRAPLHSRRLEP